jgi:protease secretion system outer membrane protein
MYPGATVSYAQADVGTGARGTTTLSLVQPVASYSRFLNLQRTEPLSDLADQEARQAFSDLSLRVYRSLADVVRARETIRALDVQLKGLEEQLQRARRMRELGQGTITEVSDFEVRVAVAQANRLAQQNALEAAIRTVQLVTGLLAIAPAVDVSDAQGVGPAPAADESDFTLQVRERSAAVRIAQRNLLLQEIAARSVRARYLPEVTASVSRTSSPTGTTGGDLRFGLSLSAPLTVGSFYEDRRAATDVTRARENLRFAQENASAEAVKLWRAGTSLTREVEIRRQAVETARLSVEANLRSYQGGVRSNIHVLTSYQNLADAETALITSQLSLYETLLTQRLLISP